MLNLFACDNGTLSNFVKLNSRGRYYVSAGGTFQSCINSFMVSGVLMNIGENDDDNSYNFYGLELGYTLQTAMDKGTYRVLLGAKF